MNICLISPAFYPLIGGGETHVRTLASGLTRLGHHVVVVTNLYDSSLSQCEIIDGVEVLRTYSYLKYINAPGRVPWEECLFGLLRDIEEFLAGRTIDIIHAHCQASAILGAMIKTQWRCPLLITFHETQPELEPFGTSRSHMLYSHLPYEQIIATSHFFQEQALHFGADSRRVRLIYHGVDVDRFSPEQSGTHIRARLGVNADQPLVLLAGRFKERKGILEFVRAMAEVSHRYPKARGLITGGYNSASLEYAERVRSEIEQLRLAHIITFQQEPFPWEDMPALFACADLIIQPSYTEGLGLSLLEAMATARPVIGTAVSGIEEIIIPGINGLMVPPRDSDMLAQAIIHLLSHPTEAAKLASNAREHVLAHFNKNRMIQETLSTYRELTSKKKQGRFRYREKQWRTMRELSKAKGSSMESLTTHLVLTSDAPIDLQMHTTFSDGLWTVEELIDYLAREQFALAAVTDHDRVDTVAYVQQIAAQKNLPILAAVEISTSWRGYMVDVLCYGFDPERNTLLDLTEPIVRRQSENTQQVYLELLRKGYIFPHQHEILAKNGGEPRQLMDLICLLQNHKYTTDNTLLEKILVDAGFLLIMLDITDVVEAAHQSCAVCLIAHPGRRGGKYPCFDLPLLDQLRKEAPIDGLEVYHPSHSPQQVVAYLDYVQKHRLLMSTGSDSHGDPKQMPIKYHAKMSRLLLERVGIQVK